VCFICADLAEKLDRIIVRQDEKLDRIIVLAEINSSLHMDQFLYTEGKISRHNSDFGNRVKADYKARCGNNNCWCLLTNAVLPRNTVIGGHLFKRKWKDRSHIIGIDDVDDTRNGLPLWKPVEWAFDTSRYRIVTLLNGLTPPFACAIRILAFSTCSAV
jgi:hypothetical protein